MTFNREARDAFLRFATSSEARWSGNFRELNAAVTRMATLSPDGRIRRPGVAEEIDRLRAAWQQHEAASEGNLLERFLNVERVASIDRFDQVQLAEGIRQCLDAPSLSAAGRLLFAASRARKKSPNDADRLRKHLARFDLDWQTLRSQ